MARHLPRLIDEYFLDLQAAVHGAYKPTSTSRSHAPSAHAKAINELDSFSQRAAKAVSNYHDRKGRR